MIRRADEIRGARKERARILRAPDRRVLARMWTLHGGIFRGECTLEERAAITRLAARGLVKVEPCPSEGWVATVTTLEKAEAQGG